MAKFKHVPDKREFEDRVYHSIRRFRTIGEGQTPQITVIGQLTQRESWLYEAIVAAFENYRRP